MGWYEDHLNAVASRLKKEYAVAKNKNEFINDKQKWLSSIGWNDGEVEKIIRKMTK